MDGDIVAGNGAEDFSCGSGGVGDGFACTDVGSRGGSCQLESDSGCGAGRSNVDAAQSQWVESLP